MNTVVAIVIIISSNSLNVCSIQSYSPEKVTITYQMCVTVSNLQSVLSETILIENIMIKIFLIVTINCSLLLNTHCY